MAAAADDGYTRFAEAQLAGHGQAPVWKGGGCSTVGTGSGTCGGMEVSPGEVMPRGLRTHARPAPLCVRAACDSLH